MSTQKNNYADFLKDPRWQKKRLEILNRDNFKCRACKDDLNTLHVHHLCYKNNLKPWEYKDEDLITLCENCHKALHYIESCKEYGLETFIPVIKLLDNLITESFQEFFKDFLQSQNQ